MYKLPETFDPEVLVGRTLELVCFAAYSIYLHLSEGVLITVMSAFSLSRPGEIAAEAVSVPVAQSDLMRLLEQKVSRAWKEGASTLAMTFESSETLRIFDPSPQYESYSIKIGDQEIIV